MKSHLTLLVSLFFGIQLCITQSSIVADINLASNTFENIVFKDSLQFSNQKYTIKAKNLSAKLVDNEIVLSYQLNKTGNAQFYDIDVKAKIGDQELRIQAEQLRGTYGYREVNNASETFETVFGDLIPNYFDLKGQLTIDLVITRGRAFDCSVYADGPPTFSTWKDQKEHVFVGVAGIAGLVAGQLFKQGRDDDFAKYRELSRTFVNETDKVSARQAAEELFKKVEDQDKQYRIFSWAGVGVLAGDLLWEYIRLSKHERDRNDYDRYCGEPTTSSLQPMFIPDGLNSIVGLQFKVRF